MTTLNRYRGIDEIFDRLENVRLRRWLVRLATSVAAASAIVLLSLLVVAVSAGYWSDQPPALLRWALLATLGGIWIVGGLLLAGRVIFWRQDPAEVARFVEQAKPKLRNDLINSVQLAEDADQTSPELVQKAIEEAVRRVRRTDLMESVSTTPLKRWAATAALALIAVVTFAALQPGPFKRGLWAAVAPASHVPSVNDIELLSIAPGDTTCFAGEPVTIIARIVNDDARFLQGQVLIDGAAPRPMLAADDYTTFTCPLGAVDQAMGYAVVIGDSRWPERKAYYQINVLERVEVEGLDLNYEYPFYTALPKREVRNADGNIDAPMGTKATVTLRLSASVPAVDLEIQDGATTRMHPGSDRTSFSTVLPVDADSAYRLLVKDSAGHVLQQLPETGAAAGANAGLSGYFRIRAEPDAKPKIQFVLPNKDVMVSPGGQVPTRIKVYDKYGVSGATLYAGKEGAETLQPLFRYATRGAKEGEFDYAFNLASGYAEGDVIVYYALATDNRNLPGVGGPQLSEPTKRFKITVQDAAKVAAEKSKRFEELRKRLFEILRMQETERVNTEICWQKHKTVEQIRTSGQEIADAQRKIKAALLDLAEKFPFDQEMVAIQQAVALLANNEAQTAIDQAQVLVVLQQFPDREKACVMLGGTQNKIIDTLQTLLAIMPSALKEEKDPTKDAAGGDIPPEVQEKLAELKQQMEKFIEAERKAIKASERLAKKTADNFTKEDEALLKELLNTQDEWEKFINEAFTDFSKLAQQDFSTPSMLKELVAVKSDVTMAKDALSKKANEIATAIENSGIENAETLTANLEKWLPDEPDRTKWQMEDPAGGQENVEQAELPTELEDLVGDLLEQEEDLFEEMDDVSSKYTASFDKGVGWDAMDGPIASMNAQGVTGNQLPNTNEMGGRSGEGRSGKSGGEFVEDKAVGKGGRRTPTRLTPEPFQQGQVDDTSTEPPGGATGGGKVSGGGEEGLEGPVPPPLAKELERMAGKQAALVNRAERMQAKFKPGDYGNFKFLQAITLMNQVKGDLENHRYHNALRAQKQLLGTMKEANDLLTGKIDVEADSSSSMPKYIRDDIADAMKGKMPEQYRSVLEQYYRRLGEQQ